MTRFNPFWKLKVYGLENIDKNRTYVIVANHQSLADIVILYRTKMQFKWVSKESVFKVPFVGWCLGLAKHIAITRGSFSSIKKVYKDAVMWLRNGISVLFFPEGTRSRTDGINEFRNGAFKLAIKERVPILPILISGTRDAIPSGSWIFSARIYCELRVLPAISTEGLNIGNVESLKELTLKKLKEI